MGARVTVKFKENYVASRGAGISGAKGDERVYPMSPDLKNLIDAGTVSVVRKEPAKKREKAAKKSPAK